MSSQCKIMLISLFNVYMKKQCYPWLMERVKNRNDEGKVIEYPKEDDFKFENIKENWSGYKEYVTQGLVLTPEQKDHIDLLFILRQPWAWTFLLAVALYRDSLTLEQQSEPKRFKQVSDFFEELYLVFDKEGQLNLNWTKVLPRILKTIFGGRM